MLSTQLAARAQEDIQFKLLNIEQLQNQIVEQMIKNLFMMKEL